MNKTRPLAGSAGRDARAPRSPSKRYYFRVAAVTLNGQSPWSNKAVKLAP